MKRSILIPICIALLVIVSCMSNEVVEVQQYNAVQTKSDSIAIHKDYSVDTPIQYLAEINHNEWVKIRHIEDRIKACNPTQEELERMSTEAILKSLVHYPLNYLIFSYEDPLMAINLLAERSLIHHEFEKRSDAAQAIIKLFSEVEDIEMNPHRKSFSEFKRLQYVDEIFLEYYMASGRIPNIYSKETADELCKAINTKIEDRTSRPEVFSNVSLQPLLLLGANPELCRNLRTIVIPPSIGTTTVYTPFGKRITAIINQDFSQPEIASITLGFVLDWDEAYSIAPATNLYNCHSYAWHNTSEYNDLWIPKDDALGNFQLSRYWISDLYTSCIQSQAEKVFYYNTLQDFDHSAIVLTNGLVVSKWGYGPLMVHEADYCPYFFANTELQYYKERADVPFESNLISGESHLSPGQSSIYYRGSFYYSDPVYTWSIISYPTDPDCAAPTMNVGMYTNYANITFPGEGLYIVRLEVSYNDIVFSYSQKYVYVY